MAKSNEVNKYLRIIDRIRSGKEVSNEEIRFFAEYTSQIDEGRLGELREELSKQSKEGKADPNLTAEYLLMEAQKQMQSPQYKDQILQLGAEQEGKELTDKVAQGLNILLSGADIVNSVKQIKASDAAIAKNARPGRPAIPRRDMMLQQALRQAQEGTYDASRAIAPIEAQIQDQYNTDLANAKTAATGQAGAFGAYAQLAANRRNRSALDIAPIADSIKRQEQANYNNLLGMRMGETQNMFDNQATLYNQDLYQYRQDQNLANDLGATGRSNLRTSMANLGNFATQSLGDNYTKRRYRNLYNQFLSYGPDVADIATKNANYLDKQMGYESSMNSDDTPYYWQ